MTVVMSVFLLLIGVLVVSSSALQCYECYDEDGCGKELDNSTYALVTCLEHQKYCYVFEEYWKDGTEPSYGRGCIETCETYASRYTSPDGYGTEEKTCCQSDGCNAVFTATGLETPTCDDGNQNSLNAILMLAGYVLSRYAI